MKKDEEKINHPLVSYIKKYNEFYYIYLTDGSNAVLTEKEYKNFIKGKNVSRDI